MTDDDTDFYEIGRIETTKGFVFVLFLNGRPLPMIYWHEEQASVAVEFLSGRRESRWFSRRLIPSGAQGLPPGCLLLELYEGDEFLGFIVWGPTGILPDVFPTAAVAVEAAVTHYEDRRAPDNGYDI